MGKMFLPIRSTARELIIQQVCRAHGLPVPWVLGKSRVQRIVRARQEIMWKLNLLGLSMPQIGKRLNRDHTTVLHGIRKHQKRIEEGEA
jgi:chromosomal replication initiation ATPase DnaA